MSIISAPGPDYGSLDFQSLRARLIELCRSVFPNLDLDSLAELATLLLETNAWIGDVLAYYLRAVGREARITTATQRRGLLGLVKLIGFTVPGATAATATETFTLTVGVPGAVTLPRGSVVQTAAVTAPIKYQLLADLVIPAATTIAAGSNGQVLAPSVPSIIYAATTTGYAPSGTINVATSAGTQTVTYTSVTGGGTSSFNGCTGGVGTMATGGAVWAAATATVENSAYQSDVLSSSGAANQTFLLTQTPYVDATLQVTDAVTGPFDAMSNPAGWREVPNFLASLPTDHVFTTTVDNLDRCLVTFGNGVTGAVPSGAVTFSYKTGGGAAGTVVAGALAVLADSFSDSFGNPVAITVTNPTAAAPGTDRYTVAQIQQLAPASLTVQGRAVANSDYEIVANLTPGVLRSLFLTATEDPSVPWNVGMGFVVPIGGGQPSVALLQRITAQFEPVVGYPPPKYPKPNAFPVTWLGVYSLTVNVSALLYLTAGAQPAVVGAAIRAALASFFSPTLADGSVNPLVDFGFKFQDASGVPTGSFAWSNLFDLVAGVPGVSKIDPGPSGFTLNGARADVALGNMQFPQLGSVTLVNSLTGLPM